MKTQGGEVDCCINSFTLANGVWLGAGVSGLAHWFVEHRQAGGEFLLQRLAASAPPPRAGVVGGGRGGWLAVAVAHVLRHPRARVVGFGDWFVA